MNNTKDKESSIPQNLNKFSIQDLYTFKEDLLQSLKKYRIEMSSKIKDEYYKCQELVSEVNKKIELFDKNNLQFLTKLNFIEEKDKILEKIKTVEKDIKNSIMVQEIHLNTCQKELSKSIYKYDKAISDNLLVPALIGPGCQFSSLKGYILNNKQEISNFFSASKQREVEYKDFKDRINTFLSQMNIKTNIIRNNIEKSVNSKVAEFENKFGNDLDDIKDKCEDLNSAVFQNKQKFYILENRIADIYEKFENIKTNNDNGKKENDFVTFNSNISTNNNNNDDEIKKDIKSINKNLNKIANMISEKNSNSPNNSKKKTKKGNNIIVSPKKNFILNNSKKTNNINIVKELNDMLINLIKQIPQDKKTPINLPNPNFKTNNNDNNTLNTSINNNNFSRNNTIRRSIRKQLNHDINDNCPSLFNNREINSCLKEYIDGKITAEDIKFDPKNLHEARNNININYNFDRKDSKNTKRRYTFRCKEKIPEINLPKKSLKIAQENDINIFGQKKLLLKHESMPNTLLILSDENTIKTPERSLSKKHNSIKLSELIGNIDNKKNLKFEEETTSKIDIIKQNNDLINLKIKNDKKNNNFEIIENYSLTFNNHIDIEQKGQKIYEKMETEIDDNNNNSIKNKIEDNKNVVIKEYKSKPKIIINNLNISDRPIEIKQKFRSFSKDVNITEKSRNNENNTINNTFQKKLINDIHVTASINAIVPEDKKTLKQNDSIKVINKKEQKILNNKRTILFSNINKNNPTPKINQMINSKSPKINFKNSSSSKKEHQPKIKNLLTLRNDQNGYYGSSDNMRLTANSDESNDLYLDKDIINNLRYVKDENLIDEPLIISSKNTFLVDKRKTMIENKLYELEFFTKKKLDELVKEIKNFIPIHFNAYIKDYSVVKYK